MVQRPHRRKDEPSPEEPGSKDIGKPFPIDLRDTFALSEAPNGRARFGLPYYREIRSFYAEFGEPNLTPLFR
jgi:hypothetical protein